MKALPSNEMFPAVAQHGFRTDRYKADYEELEKLVSGSSVRIPDVGSEPDYHRDKVVSVRSSKPATVWMRWSMLSVSILVPLSSS